MPKPASIVTEPLAKPVSPFPATNSSIARQSPYEGPSFTTAETRSPDKVGGAAAKPTLQRPRALRSRIPVASDSHALGSAHSVPATQTPTVAELQPRSSTGDLRPRLPAERELGVRSRSKGKSKQSIPHKGFVLDLLAGTMGCLRQICASSHDADPGVRVHGFLGGNIGGWVEFGLAGGWGKLEPRGAAGQNALSLYGIDPAALEQKLQSMLPAGSLDVDLAGLTVQSAKMQSAQGGPMLRFNFIPRGRVALWTGAGVGYHLLRTDYQTALGPTRFDVHGLSVPIQGGLAVYFHKNFAFVGQFDYTWTHSLLAVIDHPAKRLLAPIQMIDEAMASYGTKLKQDLPHMWAVTFGLRTRL